MSLKISDRTVKLVCPVCGCDNFIFSADRSFDDLGDDVMVQCALCKKQFTKEQIIAENQESIEAEIEAMADEAVSQTVKELKKHLRN